MPARTGVRSRAVDDRVRSLPSSDPGSAIEGFGQKISLHNKLTDLGMELGNLGVAVGLNLGPLVVEHLGQLPDCLALPRRNLRRVQFVLARQLRNRPVALDRLQRNLGLELSREPPACPHGGSSSSSSNPPSPPVSETGTTSRQLDEQGRRDREE